MEERNFMDLLHARWDEGRFICVGLDSDVTKLPVQHIRSTSLYSSEEMLIAQSSHVALQEGKEESEELEGDVSEVLSDTMLDFNKAIVDATKDLVCAYKPNSAFYEALGWSGQVALEATIYYIRDVAPEIPIILDFKRGDIGNTNLGYVDTARQADAVTVHPYLGMEAMQPFLDQKDKGIIVLVRTSNPGAGEFQDLDVDVGQEVADQWELTRRQIFHGGDDEVIWPKLPLYQVIAHRITRGWNTNGNCAVVVGATYPDELAEVRRIVGDMPILIPGIGAQGGELEATVKAGANSRGQGMIINSSRGIIFASDGADFAEVAHREALKLHNDITAVLAAA